MQRLFLLLLFTSVLPLQGRACPQQPPPKAYQVEILGAPNKATLTVLRNASALIEEQQTLPPSFPALQYRAETDVKRFIQILHALGYYSATAKIEYEREPPLSVSIILDVGSLFTLSSVEVATTPSDYSQYPVQLFSPACLGLKLGSPALSQRILDAETKMTETMREQGYALARVLERNIIVDIAEEEVAITFTVDSGPFCFFGTTDIEGLKTVRCRFVAECLGWSYGQPYNLCAISTTVDRLRRANLFASINVTHDDEAPDGILGMNIALRERKQRTITLGALYSRDEGAGGLAQWQHRNLTGRGESLTLRGIAAQKRQEGEVVYRRPHFVTCDQDLVLSSKVRHLDILPYGERTVILHGKIERRFGHHFWYEYGLKAEQLHTFRSTNDGDFTLLSIPTAFRFDMTDDLLNPTCGWRFRLLWEPTTNLYGKTTNFTKQKGNFSFYRALDRKKWWIFGAWATLGSIVGASDADIPPPRRFYAGSDTELRGYRYQSVSPLGAGTRNILGGRSIAIAGVELRRRFSENWGFVTFYEVGNVYKSPWPQLNHKQLNSVGFGPRYFTGVGPISLDIAFPLNRRPHIDHYFEVYVNIGQTF